jgi:seryl-tRNA synthetase
METLKMEFNAANKEVGDRKKASKGKDKCEELIEKTKEIKKQIEARENEARELDAKRTLKLKLIGNMLSDKAPVFQDEEQNEVVTKWGEVPDL